MTNHSDQNITNRFTISGQGSDNYSLVGNSGTFTEGSYELSFSGKDTTTNLVTTKILNIVYDGTAAVIDLISGDGRLTILMIITEIFLQKY